MKTRRGWGWLVAVCFAAYTLQVTLAEVLRAGPAWPDFCLAVVMFAAMRSGGRVAGWCGLGLGLAVDAFAGRWLGFHSLVWGAVGYAFGRLSAPFDERNRLVAFVGTGLGAALAWVMEAAFVASQVRGADAVSVLAQLVPHAVGTAALVAAVAPYDLGLPPRAQAEHDRMATIRLWL
ncbi:MAG: rod shape-determining protein MreD [Clostridia bacterium]|nr:rod shape-determining protein MreD [Clostridia bacterium]